MPSRESRAGNRYSARINELYRDYYSARWLTDRSSSQFYFGAIQRASSHDIVESVSYAYQQLYKCKYNTTTDRIATLAQNFAAVAKCHEDKVFCRKSTSVISQSATTP